MRIANPHLLWLLLAVPAVVLAFVVAFNRRRRLLARLGTDALVRRMSESVSVPRKVVRAIYLVTAVALMALALARPQAGGRAKLERQRGLDLVVALDFSKSMLAKDIYPSRIERAKRELERLMDRLAGDRIGLVAFAGDIMSYPPTTDYSAVKLFWRDLGPGDMPVGGTAIGRAITASLDFLKRLRARGGETRAQVILLLTDGEDTESEPLRAADEAARLGVKIYTVGIGSRSGELVPDVDAEGNVRGYLKDSEGKYVTSRLAEDLLTQIASKTGGEYLRADAKRFGVETIEVALNGLKRTENEARLVKQYDEMFEILILPAFLLLVGEACASERRRRRAARPPASTAAAVLLLLPLLPFLTAFEPWRAPNPAVAAGNERMKEAKPEQALAEYEKAVKALPADPGVHFNRGAALFGLSRWDEAAQSFLRATEAKERPLKAAAFYNLGNSFFKAEKFGEAVEAYKRALAHDPTNANAKWNLELALRQKKDQEEKDEQKKDEDKNKKDDKEQKKDEKEEEEKKEGAGEKSDQQKDQEQKEKSEQDQKEQEQKEQEQKNAAPEKPATGDKGAEAREMDAVLDSLEKSPKDLEQYRAQQRAVRRQPPAKDW